MSQTLESTLYYICTVGSKMCFSHTFYFYIVSNPFSLVIFVLHLCYSLLIEMLPSRTWRVTSPYCLVGMFAW